MKKIAIIFMLVSMLGGCSENEVPAEDIIIDEGFLIAGYLPDYGLNRIDMGNLEYLDRIYYFSIAPDVEGYFNVASTETEHIQLIKEKLKQEQELFLVVGGWVKSEHIHTMAATSSKRKAYAQALLQYCKQNNIDGVDLDWEAYPKPVNESHFTELVKELYNTLHPEQIILTVAVGTGHAARAVKVVNYVDQINLMSYGKFDNEGNQATFSLMKNWLNNFTSNGIPKEKIIVGVPFFGRRPINSEDASPIAITYQQIVNELQPSPELNKFGDYSFNGLKLMQQKTEYLIQNEFGGIMAWELSQDVAATSEYSLLKTIYNSLNK